MGEEIDFSSALPLEFEVEIKHRADLLRLLAKSRGSIRLGLRDSVDEAIDFRFEFDNTFQDFRDPNYQRGSHPVRMTVVDLLIANEIFERIGLFITDTVETVLSHMPPGVTSDFDSRFLFRNGVLVPHREYLEQLFDLAHYRDRTSRVIFNVTDVTLTNPTRVKAYVTAVMMNVNLLSAPAAPVVAASQTTAIIQTIADVGLVGIGTGTLYYVIKTETRTSREAPINDKIKFYQDQINKNHLKSLQYDLRLVGAYDGPLDGIIGSNSRRAIARIASSHNLPPDIDYKDPTFLRALASDAVDYRPPAIGPMR